MSENGTFYLNDVNHNNDSGFYLDYSDHSTFNNNIISNNSLNGVHLKHSTYNTIEWNTIHYSPRAIYIDISCYGNTL